MKCIEDEIPFEVPEGWAWARLASICEIITKGASPKWQGVDYTTTGTLFVTSENIGIETLLLESPKYLSNRINEIQPRSVLKKHDVLTNIVGASIGRTCEYSLDKLANTNQAVAIIRLVDLNLVDFIVKCLNSAYCIDLMLKNQVNVARANLSLSSLANFLIPIPPISEKHRIIEKVTLLFSQVAIISEDQLALKTIVSKTKAKILDLAIRGQLVEQNPNDEPASALLERIRTEKEELIKQGKIKRDKKESFIFKGADNSYYEKIGSEVRCIDEEIPFELPDGWRWARLKTICSKIIDGSHNPPKGAGEKTTYIMASSRNISFDTVTDLENVRYLNDKDFEKENARSQLAINDILLTTVATLGRSCIYDGFPENLCFQRSVTVITTDILPQYLKLFFDAPYFQDFIVSNATGTAQKGFYLNQLEGALVCVPPAKEQKRLSTKIQQILSNIQNIEKSLN